MRCRWQSDVCRTRLTDNLNPDMGDEGYGMHFIRYWDVTLDYMRYRVHDADVVRNGQQKISVSSSTPPSCPESGVLLRSRVRLK